MRRIAGSLLLIAVAVTTPARAFVWPNTAERIERDLDSHADTGARRRAAARLTELPRAVARRLTKKALEDPDMEVRLSAVEAALQLGVRDAGPLVVGWLNDPERRLRLAAAELLRAAPTPRATAALGRVLGDPDAGVRAAAAAALAASGDKAASMPLLGHLDDSAPEVRKALVTALARLGDRRAVVPLIGKIQDARPEVRRAVALALGELGDPRASSALVLALRDNDESVRIAALSALALLGDKGATLAIVSLLEEDTRDPVRVAALDALAHIRSAEGIEALMHALASDDPYDGDSAVRAALVVAGAAAVPRLLQCLAGQPSPGLADGCALALGAIGGKKAGAAISAALRRGVVRSRAALGALQALGDPATLPTVLEHLRDQDPFVRRAAIDASAALLDPHHPDGRAVEPIARALAAPGSSIAERSALASLLGRTGSPRAAQALAPLATDSDSASLRAAAIEALGVIGPAGQDAALLSALDADESGVRLAAAVALSRAASGSAAAALLDRLDRAAEQDRAAIEIALGGALARSKNPADLARADRVLAASHDGERDALIEAMGRVPGRAGSARLAALVPAGASVADRAKIAEALAAHAEAVPLLRTLAKDADGSVRANAIWSLGQVGAAAERPVLVAALQDPDVAVAGNAAAALGRLSLHGVPVAADLCRAVEDSRTYVRANALSALRVAGKSCGSGARARELLERDRSEIVRSAAAALIAAVPSADPAADRAALARCAADDPSGAVASACTASPPAPVKSTDPVAVFVVPLGEASPVSRAPFALVLADGMMRLGLADRRGEVFEANAPSGLVSLAVPAPLAL